MEMVQMEMREMMLIALTTVIEAVVLLLPR